MKRYSRIMRMALMGVGLGPVASAVAAIDLRWSTIDGGGMQLAAGGTFALNATAGQSDAGPAMTGGSFALTGGFWTSAAAPGCLTDINHDGVVDLNDLSQLLVNFGTAEGATFEDGDVDGDGDVDLADLSTMLVEFGVVCD